MFHLDQQCNGRIKSVHTQASKPENMKHETSTSSADPWSSALCGGPCHNHAADMLYEYEICHAKICEGARDVNMNSNRVELNLVMTCAGAKLHVIRIHASEECAYKAWLFPRSLEFT